MRIIYRKYKDENKWEVVSEAECLKYTERRDYWKKGTVLKMLENGELVFTPFATFKMV